MLQLLWDFWASTTNYYLPVIQHSDHVFHLIKHQVSLEPTGRLFSSAFWPLESQNVLFCDADDVYRFPSLLVQLLCSIVTDCTSMMSPGHVTSCTLWCHSHTSHRILIEYISFCNHIRIILAVSFCCGISSMMQFNVSFFFFHRFLAEVEGLIF